METLGGSGADKRKVHMRTISVWILMSPRADLRNSIHVFTREDHVVYGPNSPRLGMVDDDAIVFVCLGDPEEDGGGPMPDLLEALDWSMFRGIDDRKRVEKLSDLGYEIDGDMESELIGMNSIEADRERRAMREGIVKGKIEGKIEDARNMLAIGMTDDQIRDITGLTDEQIQEAKKLSRGIIMNSIEADRERRARREGIVKGKIEGKIEDASRMLAIGMSEDQVRDITGLTEEQIQEARNLRRS